jgi:hypothetical protein
MLALCNPCHPAQTHPQKSAQVPQPTAADRFTEMARGLDNWLGFVAAHSPATK